MTLTFDWFLPTSGDGRTIYGRGHSLPIAQAQAADRPPDIEYLGQVARAAEQLGFAAVLTPTGTWCEDAWLATAALITADQQAEVPGRLPARADLAHPGRPDGRQLPADLPRPAAAQRGDRGPGRGAAAVRRPPVARRAVRPHRRVPRHRAGRLERAAVRLLRPVLPGRAGHRDAAAGPGTRRLLRRLVGGRRAGRGPLRRHVPDLGRAAGPGGGEAGLDARAGRRGGPGAEVRHPAARDHPGHRAGGLGGGGRAARPAGPGGDRHRPADPRPHRVGRPGPDARAARVVPAQRRGQRPGGLPAPVGRGRPGARRRGHRAGRQPRAGGRPDRGVRVAGHLGVHPVRVPAPGGGVLVRRGRAARAAPARGVGAGGAERELEAAGSAR